LEEYLAYNLKVLVIDDTVVYRKILGDLVSEIDNCELIGSAPNGELALRKMSLSQPDLVLCDVEMPVMDGLTTLREIKKTFPSVGVIMVSGVTERQAAITMEALQIGALDFIPKPQGHDFAQNKENLKSSLIPIINLFLNRKILMPLREGAQAAKPAIEAHRPTPVVAPTPIAPAMSKSADSAPVPNRFDILVVGVSTGGPNALAQFIPLLPEDLGVPVMIVQHMPPMFTKSLANHLQAKSKVKVMEAEPDQPLIKGQVLIAPGGKHLIVQRNPRAGGITTGIIDTPPVNSCKPSVDVLFDSIPTCYSGNILSLVMTGMGSDGTNGVRTMKRAGCFSLTQSEDSCVVYGMPRAVVEAGLSDEATPLDRLANRVADLIRSGRRG
jgi:two-component system, chemotaxis family, protein-glutamate methylesterase/glutaminase